MTTNQVEPMSEKKPRKRVPKPSSDTLSVPEAGQRLGIAKNAAYQAAERGELPVLRIGRLLRVPKVALERMLENPGRGSSSS